MREEVFNEEMAKDSIERKFTRGLYFGCGVLVVFATDTLQETKQRYSSLINQCVFTLDLYCKYRYPMNPMKYDRRCKNACSVECVCLNQSI